MLRSITLQVTRPLIFISEGWTSEADRKRQLAPCECDASCAECGDRWIDPALSSAQATTIPSKIYASIHLLVDDSQRCKNYLGASLNSISSTPTYSSLRA